MSSNPEASLAIEPLQSAFAKQMANAKEIADTRDNVAGLLWVAAKIHEAAELLVYGETKHTVRSLDDEEEILKLQSVLAVVGAILGIDMPKAEDKEIYII